MEELGGDDFHPSGGLKPYPVTLTFSAAERPQAKARQSPTTIGNSIFCMQELSFCKFL